MAEALGVVASGIAVGQAVSALGLVVFRIKRLCDEVGSIPQRIDHLLAELEILNPVIDGTGAALSLPDGGLVGIRNDPSASKAVMACRRASEELEAFATEIQRRLNAPSHVRRKFTGLKAVFKKDEVSALEKRLENAVRVLSLAQNLHLMHLVRSHHELVMERLSVSSTGLSPAVAERSTSQLVNVPAEEEQTTHAPNRADDSCSHPDSQDVWPTPPKTGQFIFRQAPGGFKARIVTPTTGLAVRRAWELLISRSYVGWKIVFQPIIRSPDDAFLKELARAGAIDDLQYLFRSRQAVIRDDADFHNDLLCAATCSNVSTVRMLLHMGLKWPKRVSGFPAAVGLLISMASDLREGIDSPWLDFVLSDEIGTCWNPQLFNMYGNFVLWTFWHFLVSVRLNSDVLRRAMDLRTLRNRLVLDYDRLSHVNRLLITKILNLFGFDESDQAELFRLSLCSTGELSPSSVVLHSEGTRSLLPREMFEWARMLVKLGSVPENWTRILRDTVTIATLTTLDGEDVSWVFWGETPLLGLVKGTVYAWDQEENNGSPVVLLTRVLVQWLDVLQEMGIELDVYGEWEVESLREWPEIWDHAWCTRPYDVFAELPKCHASTHDPNSGARPVRLRKLVVGSKPADWRFEWEICEEEWAGLFWSLVEDPGIQEEEETAEPKLPGSWVE
ncbi:hypothetical protein QBC47DRAFT_391621 [Echria macrotheca]|uniref:Fungal N-terminal domain-containing protein n=1 Tax=Echria macrotheca TaxID=438768 RepID=A0AAJ0F5F9_9PEZI|nr:hypothetical protein QBC47DRAFT_391621 [Echria macrotheca]